MAQNKGASALQTGPSQVEPGTVSPLRASVPSAVVLDDLIAHLGAAIIQSLPTDDQRIMEHVRSAHGLARILRRAQ